MTEILQHVEYVLIALLDHSGEPRPGANFAAYRLAKARAALVNLGGQTMMTDLADAADRLAGKEVR